MKEIHQEKITLYVDDERSSAKIEDLGAFAEADKTVEEAYALGRSGSIFTKYSDVKRRNINFRFIANMIKRSLKRM